MISKLPHGLHRDVPAGVYHAREIGVANKSALDEVHRSPAHYLAWVRGEVDAEETPALAFGAALHTAALEPEKFETIYAVEPDFGDCRFKENKARRDEWRRDNAGRKPLAADDFDRISAMVRSLRAHPLAGAMVRDGEAELTARWRDAETGIECKARADYRIGRHKLLVDVKSAIDASPDEFAREVVNYGYHRQAAFYTDGFRAVGEDVEHFALIVVEKKPPFAVAIYTLDDDAITVGRRQIRADLATLAECLKTDKWPGYGDGIRVLRLPPWAA